MPTKPTAEEVKSRIMNLLLAYKDERIYIEKAYDLIMRQLSSLTPSVETGWISVEDRLPNAGETVLICQSGSVDFGWYKDIEELWCDAYVDGLMNVTHWQPLPSPPTK